MIDSDFCNKQDNEEEINPPCLMVSSCCGAIPLGGVDEDAYGNIIGICSECHDHSSFTQQPEKE